MCSGLCDWTSAYQAEHQNTISTVVPRGESMSLSTEAKLHINQVATESISMLSQVAEIAAAQRSGKGLSLDAMAWSNTTSATKTAQALDEINLARMESSQVLAREPAVARVVVLDEQGNPRTYYICRATPVTGAPGLLASYNAPVGLSLIHI
mgnify:CR=1 FL=1